MFMLNFRALLHGVPRGHFIYEAALLLLALAMVLYGLVVGRLLGLIERRFLEVLPFIGSLLLVISAAIHFFTNLFIVKYIAVDPEFYKLSMKLRTVSMFCLLLAGLLTLLGGWLYYRKMG
jgi:hypothetical protein